MKKGFIHIDWVISFGIFIVFLLLLFIWFGPALTENYNNEYLKTIAQQGFEDQTFVRVIEYPVYVDIVDVDANQVFNVSLPNSMTDVSKLSVLRSNYSQIEKKKIENNMLYFMDDTTPYSSGDVLNYTLYYSNILNLAHDGNGLNPTQTENYHITLGVGKEYFAFSESNFTGLTSLSYNDFKKKLKYPNTRGISIFVYSTGAGSIFENLLYSYNESQPLENQDVYVITSFTKIVKTEGYVDYVTTIIKTW